MPNIPEEKIKGCIADGSIFAVSIDTSIFDRYGCNLEFPVLIKMNQFRVGEFRFLLSEIVYNEIRSHIRRDALESQRALGKALKEQSRRWRLGKIEEAITDRLKVAADPADEALKQVDAFVAAVGAEIIPISEPPNIGVEVVRRYFSSGTPFEQNEKKKHEFPDAFALLSLEYCAILKKRMILCVSQDKGWHRFAESSSHIVAIDDLERALSLFNEAGRPAAEKLVAMLRDGAIDVAEIESAVQSRLDDNDFEIDARSHIDFDIEEQWATLEAIDFKSTSSPIVIANSKNETTFTVKIRCSVNFSATFAFYVRDSIDRDIVNLGSQNEEVLNEIEISVTITATEEENTFSIVDSQASQQAIHANFGSIEPFKDEDPTFEKY